MTGMKRPPPSYQPEEDLGNKRITTDDVNRTFVLGYPCLHTYRSVGSILIEFEKSNLSITEMRCMHVSEAFARRHLNNIHWDLEAWDDTLPTGKWYDYLSSGPVIAMVVEGDDCMQKVSELISKKQLPFWIKDDMTVYTSNSPGQVKDDIALWFSSIDTQKVLEVSDKVLYVLPNILYGPTTEVMDFIKRDPGCNVKTEEEDSIDVRDYLLLEKMRVFLIKPLAFQNHCVGEISYAIEANCCILTGLKLVKKADCPSDAWPMDSYSSSDEYGVAVVAYEVGSSLEITHENPDVKRIDPNNGLFEIGSNYIHQSEPGQEVLKHATQFFKTGFSVWAYPESITFSGWMFEASVVGLDSMEASGSGEHELESLASLVNQHLGVGNMSQSP